MPSTVLANWTKMVVVAGGTGNLELASVLGYPTLTQTAGLNTGVHYVILSADGEPIETGIGQIGAGNVFTRTEVLETFADGVYDTTSPALADIPAGATVHTAVTKGLLTDLLASVASGTGKALLGHWPAGALTPRKTAPCAAFTTLETATNAANIGFLGFSAAADSYAIFEFLAPKALAEASGIIAVIHCGEAAGATAHGVAWRVSVQSQGHGALLDGAWASADMVVATASGQRTISAQSSAIAAGTLVEGGVVLVQVGRIASDALNDTLNVDAYLFGVALYAVYASAVEP